MRKLPQRATGLGMDGDVSSDGTRRPDRRAATGGELRLDAVAEAEGPSPSSVVVPATPATVLALAPGRYKVQFTASEGLREKLERLQTLMRSSVPDGDLADVIEAAVTEKLERPEARRFARTKAPRKGRAEAQVKPSSRHIPAAVRRAVYERDGNRCRFVDEQGRRCTARDALEYHHRHPFGLGGDHSADGISLLCRTHNQHLAEVDFGRRAMAAHRRSKRSTTGPPRLERQA
jgi:5-methylcytosine-specific restriction endonuclease McrA